jgi:hypothetical protein
MARRRSFKSLKSEKPHWYCLSERFGSVRGLAASGIKLSYVTDPRDIASIWKYLGNPRFKAEYDYLLINNDTPGVLTDIYAVRLPRVEGTKRSRNFFVGDFDAFAGEVDKIVYGWASQAAVKAMLKTGKSTGVVDHTDEL